MAQDLDFRRTAITNTVEDAEQTAVVTEIGTDNFLIDFKATVNAAARLLHRFKFELISAETSPMVSWRVSYLDYSDAADATYTDGLQTTPFTEAEARSVTVIGVTPAINMDALFTLAEA